MTLNLSELHKLILSAPEVPSYLTVSPEMWNQILEIFKDHDDLQRVLMTGVRLELGRYYKPDWWSEHYRDRMVLHTDKGQATLPAVKMPFWLQPRRKEFKIEVPKMPVFTLGKIGYDAYCKFTNNKSLISGADLPAFEKLPPPIQDAWEKAGQAVAASVGRGGEVFGEIPELAPEPETGSTQIQS